MLREADLFPNVGRSNPTHVRDLLLQDRVYLRMITASVSAHDLLTAERGPGVATVDDPDEVQDAACPPKA
jgi:hypothetical protein